MAALLHQDEVLKQLSSSAIRNAAQQLWRNTYTQLWKAALHLHEIKQLWINYTK
jgi:hypothetical protein